MRRRASSRQSRGAGPARLSPGGRLRRARPRGAGGWRPSTAGRWSCASCWATTRMCSACRRWMRAFLRRACGRTWTAKARPAPRLLCRPPPERPGDRGRARSVVGVQRLVHVSRDVTAHSRQTTVLSNGLCLTAPLLVGHSRVLKRPEEKVSWPRRLRWALHEQGRQHSRGLRDVLAAQPPAPGPARPCGAQGAVRGARRGRRRRRPRRRRRRGARRGPPRTLCAHAARLACPGRRSAEGARLGPWLERSTWLLAFALYARLPCSQVWLSAALLAPPLASLRCAARPAGATCTGCRRAQRGCSRPQLRGGLRRWPPLGS